MPISVAAVACALAFGAPTARANVIYEYTGEKFTTFISPYTANDYVHGTFTVASALAPNLVDVDISAQILSFAFNDFADNHLEINSEASGGYWLTPTISTDASGDISFWSLGFRNGLLTHFISSFNVGGWGADVNAGLDVGNVNPYSVVAWNLGAPGTWSSSASAVPEPSGLVLLCTGVVVVGASLRRS